MLSHWQRGKRKDEKWRNEKKRECTAHYSTRRRRRDARESTLHLTEGCSWVALDFASVRRICAQYSGVRRVVCKKLESIMNVSSVSLSNCGVEFFGKSSNASDMQRINLFCSDYRKEHEVSDAFRYKKKFLINTRFTCPLGKVRL